jgi:phosphohistidine phosphatase
MKTLLLLRHAKSSWKQPELADHDRPLNKRGQRDAPRMGRLLKKENLTPDLIVSSTAKRAHDTAEVVAETSGYEDEVDFRPELYMAEPETYLGLLKSLSDDYQSVMLVGHNPGLEELLELLTGESETLPTAALAEIQLPLQRWKDLSSRAKGKLINLWRARELE